MRLHCWRGRGPTHGALPAAAQFASILDGTGDAESEWAFSNRLGSLLASDSAVCSEALRAEPEPAVLLEEASGFGEGAGAGSGSDAATACKTLLNTWMLKCAIGPGGSSSGSGGK